MKATYKGFEAKKSGGFIEMPPVGAYVAEIQDVRFVEGEDGKRDRIECMMEIIEGDYKGRYHEIFNDQQERFGNATYRGVFRIVCPQDEEDVVKRSFEGNLWCVQESNPGYSWDWNEKKLKGKKVGISLRKRLYTYNGKDRVTVEIARFETVDDVRDGKCKPVRDRDMREVKEDNRVEDVDTTNGSGFTEVSSEVSVPW